MRRRSLLRPQLETMEALTLLSTLPVHPHVASGPLVDAPGIVATPFDRVSLAGAQVFGVARVHEIRAHTGYWTVPIDFPSNQLQGTRFASLNGARLEMSFRFTVTGNPKRQAFPSQADPIQFASGTGIIQRYNTLGKKIAGMMELEIVLGSRSNPLTSTMYAYKVVKATGPFDGSKTVVGILTFSQSPLQYPYERTFIPNLTATFTT